MLIKLSQAFEKDRLNSFKEVTTVLILREMLEER